MRSLTSTASQNGLNHSDCMTTSQPKAPQNVDTDHCIYIPDACLLNRVFCSVVRSTRSIFFAPCIQTDELMVVLRRPSSFDEGVQQLQLAVDTTKAPPEATTPRAKVWRACYTLLREDFLRGMRLLYEANQIVSFLFNTIVPHIEERLRYETLQVEYDKAMAKPDAVTQNEARFKGILQAIAAAETVSRNKTVDDEFASMRDAMSGLYANDTIATGLGVLYISSKTARGALDLIFKRLIDAYQNDTSIMQTTDIPIEAMLLR